jgi:serine/threonine protein kinase
MEKADGNLSSFLKDRAKVQRIPIEGSEIKLWFKMILEGLKYLHSISIAHLELRPQSILYVWDRHQKYPFVVKIKDFGMSYFAGNNRSMNLRHETEGFIAPEMEESADNGDYDPFRADIYSLGKLLDYMISFHVEKKPESEHLFITEKLDNLVYWMTDCFPDLRPTIEQIEEHAWLQSK